MYSWIGRTAKSLFSFEAWNDTSESPFQSIKPNRGAFPTTAQPWPSHHGSDLVRRASVNSFGFGGANAHVILESYDSTAHSVHSIGFPSSASESTGSDMVSSSVPSIPFVFSATTAGSLNANLHAFQAYLEQYTDTLCPASLAHHLVAMKSGFSNRISFSAESLQDLTAKIAHALEPKEGSPSNSLASRFSDHPCILGVFTGQGAQWATMGTKLIASTPLASSIIDELDVALSTLREDDRPRWSLMQELLATNTSRMNQAEISQPLCTAVQLVLVDLLRAAKVKFSAVVGHSSGDRGGLRCWVHKQARRYSNQFLPWVLCKAGFWCFG